MKEMAYVKDERTGTETYFVFLRRAHQGSVQACRFNRMDSARAVAASINKALKAEGRLLTEEES